MTGVLFTVCGALAYLKHPNFNFSLMNLDIMMKQVSLNSIFRALSSNDILQSVTIYKNI